MPKISEYPAAGSAGGTDELAANQGGTTRKITVTQIRSGLAATGHTHPAGDISGLATVATTGSAADLTGTLDLARLAQGGASVGQVLKWNGTAYAPAADATGGGGGVTTFPELSDTPASYSGSGGYFVRVNAGASALEFRSPADARTDIGAAATSHGHVISDTTGLQAALDGKASTSHNHSAAEVTSGTLAVARGGTGIASYTTNNYIRASGATALEQRTPAQVLGDIGAQAADADLTAVAALGSTGIAVRIGTDTWALRSIAQGANIAVTNGDGVAGNITIAVTGLATVATSGSASDLSTGTLAVARGGTGIASYTTSNYIRASGATTLEQRTPAQVLSDIGAAASSHAHSATDITSGTLAVARGGTGIASYTTNNYIRASGATTLEQRTPAQVLSDIGAAASSHTHALSALTQSGATSGQVAKWNGSAWAPANESSGGDPWEVVTASNPASPYTLPSTTGNAVTRVTGLAGNLTINKPAAGATNAERTFRIVEITASGGDRTITWGTGISLGLGVAPSLVVASGTTVRFVLYTDDAWTTAAYDGDFATATETSRGLVEIATAAEISAGTDTARPMCPSQFNASDRGLRAMLFEVIPEGTTITTGDGKWYFDIPPWLNGYNLAAVQMAVAAAGTTGTTDVQLRRSRGSADMLSTKLTIDSAETSSTTAAAAAVINTSNDDVQTGDRIFFDIDAVSSTPPTAPLQVWVGFRQ